MFCRWAHVEPGGTASWPSAYVHARRIHGAPAAGHGLHGREAHADAQERVPPQGSTWQKRGDTAIPGTASRNRNVLSAMQAQGRPIAPGWFAAGPTPNLEGRPPGRPHGFTLGGFMAHLPLAMGFTEGEAHADAQERVPPQGKTRHEGGGRSSGSRGPKHTGARPFHRGGAALPRPTPNRGRLKDNGVAFQGEKRAHRRKAPLAFWGRTARSERGCGHISSKECCR